MFGMEKKSKGASGFVFGLEKELGDEERRSELAKRIEFRIQKIKEILHKGSKKDQFEQMGVLLNGYHALAIVLSRASQEPQRRK